MSAQEIYDADYAPIYPGAYEPMPCSEQQLNNALNKTGARVIKPPVNICELAGYYRIEMPAPGFSREDFFIHTNGRLLSIAAMNNRLSTQPPGHYRLQSFNCDCLQREIVLPADVDTDFVSAEYKNGILTICLYKTNYPLPDRPVQIIVY